MTMFRRAMLSLLALGLVFAPLAAWAVTALPPVALSTGAWTDLGVGPMRLSMVGQLGATYQIADTTPSSVTTIVGQPIPNNSVVDVQTASHVWALAAQPGAQVVVAPISGSGGGGGGGTVAQGAAGSISTPWYWSMVQGGALVSGTNGLYVQPGTGVTFAGTVADGADVALGATTSTACASYSTSPCNAAQLLRLMAQIMGNALSAQGNVTTNIGNVGGVDASGAAVTGQPVLGGGRAATSEPTANANGTASALQTTPGGKLVVQPYAIGPSLTDGGGSSTTTAAITVLPASGSASLHEYMTGIQCTRSDAGTSAISISVSDAVKTRVWDIPNNGGGDGIALNFPAPIVWAFNTAVTVTPSAGVTTLHCNAQGYNAS